MTLVSTYNPDSKAVCPTCQKLVNCELIGGITFGYNPYYEMYHDKCGTIWKYYPYGERDISRMSTADW